MQLKLETINLNFIISNFTNIFVKKNKKKQKYKQIDF